MKLVGQAGGRETGAGFVCYNLEAELLLQDISGFPVKASPGWTMPTYNQPITDGDLLHLEIIDRRC